MKLNIMKQKSKLSTCQFKFLIRQKFHSDIAVEYLLNILKENKTNTYNANRNLLDGEDLNYSFKNTYWNKLSNLIK